MKYDFKTVEAKWQKVWADEKTFHAEIDHSKPKFYALVEFPYPSAAGLHVGHPRSYTALDIVARKKRQCGYNVLYPMGWDAFGLPTENYALKNHINPEIVTAQNVLVRVPDAVRPWLCTGCVRVSLHRAGSGQDRGVLHCGCPAAQASGAGRCAASERSLSPNLVPIL